MNDPVVREVLIIGILLIASVISLCIWIGRVRK
jgi:hypothetical protein